MYGCESWIIKKAECWKIEAFELWCWRRLLRVPWTGRRPNQSILKEINPEYSLGRTDAEAETPILWPPDVNNWLIGKDPDAGKDWRQEKGMTEDEMVGWHHQLNGHEFEQALGVGGGQGSLVCCSSWGHKESDMTEQLKWTEQPQMVFHVYLLTSFPVISPNDNVSFMKAETLSCSPSDPPFLEQCLAQRRYFSQCFSDEWMHWQIKEMNERRQTC